MNIYGIYGDEGGLRKKLKFANTLKKMKSFIKHLSLILKFAIVVIQLLPDEMVFYNIFNVKSREFKIVLQAKLRNANSLLELGGSNSFRDTLMFS